MTDTRIAHSQPSVVTVTPAGLYGITATSVDIDPTGHLTGAARVLYSLPSASYTGSQPSVPSGTFSTECITNMAVDITLTSFTGGVGAVDPVLRRPARRGRRLVSVLRAERPDVLFRADDQH